MQRNLLTGLRSWAGSGLMLQHLINTGLFIAGILLLIAPAIQNGFPLLHDDSGTYLYEGFNNKIPVSRPLSYCLFVRYISRIVSVWSVVIAQAMMVYWAIWLTVNTLTGKKKVAWLPFLAVAILSVTTGIAYYVSQIIPDIFLPVAMMGMFVFILRDKMPWPTTILLALVIWISLVVHLSNLPVITAVIFALLALTVLFKRSLLTFTRRNIIVLFITVVFSWMTNPFISLGYGEGFRSSNSTGIVFFSRLLQAGAAQNYIKDMCKEDEQHYLCQYLDVIDDYNRLDVFLWYETSFLYDHPCKEKTWDACWRERDEEFSQINKEILAHPTSRKIYLNAVWNDFWLQLRSFELNSYVRFKEDSHLNYPIKRYYANDYASFISSRQAKATMVFNHQNKVIHWTVYTSLLLVIIMVVIRRRDYLNIHSPFFLFMLMIVFSWLVNGALTASLAVVSNRFLGRFIWLVPLLLIMMVYREYSLQKDEVKGL